MKRFRTKRTVDERLLFAYLAAVLIGLVMIYSTSSILAESRFGSHFHFLGQQFVWALLSVAAVWLIGKVDLERYAVYSAPALLIMLLLLSLVFLMPARNGAQRWLMLGPLTVQPSELFKCDARLVRLSGTDRALVILRHHDLLHALHCRLLHLGELQPPLRRLSVLRLFKCGQRQHQ